MSRNDSMQLPCTKSLVLRSQDAQGSKAQLCRTFYLIRLVGTGGSGQAFEAYHDESPRGILKQYRPSTLHGTGGRSEDSIEQLLRPYELLLEVRQHTEDQTLAGFLPLYEMYEDAPDESSQSAENCGSIYVWMPASRVISFEDICRQIRTQEAVRPEQALVLILRSVAALLRGVIALHENGLVHRDLKPDNFGLREQTGTLLPDLVCLYDVESFCSIFAVPPETTGTPGYCEPEAGYLEPDNQTDLYSIGAILYHALIFHPDTVEEGETPEVMTKKALEKQVRTSILHLSRISWTLERFWTVILRIFERSICQRALRYGSAEVMLEDVMDALSYLTPSLDPRNTETGLSLKNVHKQPTEKEKKRLLLSFGAHLYLHPLKTCSSLHTKKESAPARSRERIVLFGFGLYGQMLCDLLTQMVQLPGQKREIVIISEDIHDFYEYLSDRPGLASCFSINGQPVDPAFCMAPFGSIRFVQIHVDFVGSRPDFVPREFYLQTDRADTVFLTLSKSSRSYQLARLLVSRRKKKRMNQQIRWVLEQSELLDAEELPDVEAADLRSHPYAQVVQAQKALERMAFNAHLLWQRQSIIDLSQARSDFAQLYSYSSSLCAALSVPAKLSGLDISYNPHNPSAVLSQLQERMNDADYSALREQLIDAEHHRWVAEKLCDGWQSLDDFSACIPGKLYDAKKRHLCLVDSRPGCALIRSPYHSKTWQDQASEDDLSKLDLLDSLSIRLHQDMQNRARQLRISTDPESLGIDELGRLCSRDKDLWAAFASWQICVEEIWNEDADRSGLYRRLTASLKEKISILNPRDAQQASEILRLFDRTFWPMASSRQYRDLKQSDAVLVDEIPFLLDCRPERTLVLFWNPDRMKILMKTVLQFCPARVVFYVRPEDLQDRNRLSWFIDRSRMLMDLRHADCRMELQAWSNTDLSSVSFEEGTVFLEDNLRWKGETDQMVWQPGIRVLHPDDPASHSMMISPSPAFSIAESMQILGLKPQASSPVHAEGETCMFALRSASPEFWNDLSSLLCEASQTVSPILFCKDRMADDRGSIREIRFYLPGFALSSLRRLMDALRSCHLIEPSSQAMIRSTQTLEVHIFSRYALSDSFSRLLQDPVLLADSQALEIVSVDEEMVLVTLDDLRCRSLSLSGVNDQMERAWMKETLGILSHEGLIFMPDFRTETGQLSLTFSSHAVKAMLLSPLRLLSSRIGAYLSRSPFFDDFALNIRLDLQESEQLIQGKSIVSVERPMEAAALLTIGLQSAAVVLIESRDTLGDCLDQARVWTARSCGFVTLVFALADELLEPGECIRETFGGGVELLAFGADASDQTLERFEAQLVSCIPTGS